MQTNHVSSSKKGAFAFLVLLNVILAVFPMLQFDSMKITVFNILKNKDVLFELGNYKSALPTYLYIAFVAALFLYIISAVFTAYGKDSLAFDFVLLGFLGNTAFFIYLLPPLFAEQSSSFTGFLYCYLGLNLLLLIYSFVCMLRSDFVAKIKYLYIDSFKHLFVTRNLVVCGMMAALAIALNFASFQIPLFQVGVSGLPNRIVDFMFGPTIGMLFAGIVDAIECFTKGYAYSIGYNIQAILGGLVYGTFYYNLSIKKPHTPTAGSWIKTNLHSLAKIFTAQIIVKIFLNILFGTYLYSIYYGKAFWAILPARTLKNLIQIPADTIVHFFLLVMFQQLRRFLLPDNTGRRGTDVTDKKEA
ncbi:MAG: folate family ECF transporter S component [Lachnospiraceae bacterium]|nr:folate family ECF transporter S component [Lachnospiraceae bacterium]